MAERRRIDTPSMLQRLRSKCLDADQGALLITDLGRSDQANDLSVPPNCRGLGRVRHFRASTDGIWPTNPLPRIPAERWLRKKLPEPLRVQVFQIAGCAWRCWYCYVPYADLSARQSRASWVTASQLVDEYLQQSERPDVLDLSGGSPDLVPEWIGWTMDALDGSGQGDSVFLWSDDNLSSELLLEQGQRKTLERIERYSGYARVCCIKGFDETSFAFNTGAREEDFDRQLRILSAYAATALDLYCYITLTSLSSSDLGGRIRRLMDRIEVMRTGLLSRVVPLQISKFGAMTSRVTAERRLALDYQSDVLDAWKSELARRSVTAIWETANA